VTGSLGAVVSESRRARCMLARGGSRSVGKRDIRAGDASATARVYSFFVGLVNDPAYEERVSPVLALFA
jgi:hypothetical protein